MLKNGQWNQEYADSSDAELCKKQKEVMERRENALRPKNSSYNATGHFDIPVFVTSILIHHTAKRLYSHY